MSTAFLPSNINNTQAIMNAHPEDVLQDAVGELKSGQFWNRTLIVKHSDKTLRYELRLEKQGIGQGYARVSYWTPNGWIFVADVKDGEYSSFGSNYDASTYSRNYAALIDWSNGILDDLWERAYAII